MMFEIVHTKTDGGAEFWLTTFDGNSFKIGTLDELRELDRAVSIAASDPMSTTELPEASPIIAETINVASAAARAGVDERTIRYACSRGQIRGATKEGKIWIIPLAQFRAWARNETARRPGRKPSR